MTLADCCRMRVMHPAAGVFNLTIKGHAACHKLMASFGVPLLVLGGVFMVSKYGAK